MTRNTLSCPALLLGVALAAAPLAAQGPAYLTGPSSGDPVTIARDWVAANLATLGLTGADVAEQTVSDSYTSRHNGVTHVYFQQRHVGIPVFAGVLNVNVSADGRVLNPGSRFVGDLAEAVNTTAPVITSADAVDRAAADLDLAEPALLTPVAAPGGATQAVVYAGDGLSLRDVPVELVYLPIGPGAVRLAWEVEIEPNDQEYWMVHADAVTGKVLLRRNLVERDGYQVYPWPAESPNHVDGTVPPADGRALVDETAADPTASPFGWHDVTGTPGGVGTVNTTGNNVLAQTDLDANDVYTPGTDHQPVAVDRQFVYPLDLTADPGAYRDAAVTNLFYWNNVLHDIHYLYGFDEASGNFQLNNYLGLGVGGDPLHADAQDGSGTNNANMLTLPEGVPPRMQMFRWTGPAVVDVNSPYTAQYPAATGWGPQLDNAGLTGDVVLVDDGAGTGSDACEPIQNDVAGKICLIDRGTCEFGTKVLRCDQAGGIAAIVANNAGDDLVAMGPGVEGDQANIPSVFIGQTGGAELEAALPANVTMRKFGVDRDSDLDNGVIIHEYGHGVSNRLTGGPVQTPICLLDSQQAGEGWSDWWAVALTQRAGGDGTEPRGVGTYVSFQDPPELGGGIRPYPYSTDLAVNPQTYGDLATGTLSVPHGVGTVWATATWEMYWALVNGVPELGLPGHGFREDVYDLTPPLAGNQLALQLVMDGLKLQPCNPTFVEGRDGILAADLANYGGANQCHIWWAFAKRGLGAAADGASSSSLAVTEDFSIPPECQTGACEVPPSFAGAAGAVSATDGACALTVHWAEAEERCETGTISYSVYRSTDPSFVPGADNLIADGLTGTSYEDTEVTSGTTYHYVVRATDGNGNTDANLRRVSEEPAGELSDSGTFADDAGDTGPTRFTGNWAVRPSGGVGGSAVYATSPSGNYPDTSCLVMESDTLYLGSDPTLTFETRWDIEPAWDGGIVEISTAAGAFADWRKLDTVPYPGVMAGALGDPNCDNPGLRDGEPAFSGTSGGLFLPIVAGLGEFADQAVRVRFVFASDAGTNDLGWFVDNLAIDDVREPGECTGGGGGGTCTEIDDADPAVEYQKGWHRKDDAAASGGGYHRRMGKSKDDGKAPRARVVFTGDSVTYHYARGPEGGSAAVFLDGVAMGSVDYGGASLEFGHQQTWSGLDPEATHELVIEHRSGAAYVDGFSFSCGGEADATAARYRSETSTDTASAREGSVISRMVTVGAEDVDVSVVVEGSLVPLTVRLLDPAGALVASGEALIAGLSISGLDAPVTTPGDYRLQIVNVLGAFEKLELSVAKTQRNE